jgi:chorismate-pyruvate lyase
VTEAEARQALRSWIAERNPDLAAGELADDTPLIERRYLTSLQVADLLVYIEELRQEPIEPASLRPGAFRSIDAIHSAFFS